MNELRGLDPHLIEQTKNVFQWSLNEIFGEKSWFCWSE